MLCVWEARLELHTLVTLEALTRGVTHFPLANWIMISKSSAGNEPIEISLATERALEMEGVAISSAKWLCTKWKVAFNSSSMILIVP